MGGGGGDGLDVSNGGGGDDPELEAIKARCREMEEEALKLKQVFFCTVVCIVMLYTRLFF